MQRSWGSRDLAEPSNNKEANIDVIQTPTHTYVHTHRHDEGYFADKGLHTWTLLGISRYQKASEWRRF